MIDLGGRVMERTLVLVKPDGVRRHLVGAILQRFEQLGLDIVEAQLLTPSTELADAHYPSDVEWLSAVGNKTLADFAERGQEPTSVLGTADPVEVGRTIKGRLTTYLTSGPVLAIVLQGNRSVEIVRKVVGATLPTSAAPGTIRGDYSIDSPDVAEREGRPIHNLIHASGNVTEAEHEIWLWFGPDR
jgi:nucleoside-diphosphate kinase